MGALQPWHLIVLLVVVLLVFGAGKLPEVGKSFGKSIKEFKSEIGSNETAKTETVQPITTVVSSTNGIVPNTSAVITTNDEPEVLVRRTTRKLEDGSEETVEERIVRKKVNS